MNDDVNARMKGLREQMNRARMRLAAERMDRSTQQHRKSAAARAEDEECGPGEPVAIGEVTSRLMESLGQIARGDVETMSVEEFRVALRRRTLDS